MSILIAVNPPYSGWLVDGIKEIEWRKCALPAGKAFVYETKKCGGVGMVIGEVNIVGWAKIKPDLFFEPDFQFEAEWYIAMGIVPNDDLKKYAKGKTIYANLVRRAKRYEKAKEITEFFKPCDFEAGCYLCEKSGYAPDMNLTCLNKVERPPQSWMYVEEIK